MVTDDERREVAGRLRAYGKEFGDATWRELCNVVLYDEDRYPSTVRKLRLIDRLADLIDPGDTSQGRRDTVACDPTERGVDSIRDWCRERLGGADGAKAHMLCSVMSAIDEWHHLERATARTARPVDRGALLGLADEMDEKARSSGYFLVSPTLVECARRIREACGLVS